MAASKKTSDDMFFTMSFMVVVALLIGLFLGYLWVHNAVTKTIKENMALRKLEQQLDNQNRELRSELTNLSRGDRIKRIARTELGMVTPEPESLVVFIDGEFYESKRLNQ
ncbi:MAG: Cell division protein FtsL [Candidatus Marinimicrobia bacterium]|nr:Cell division protein FtsL [Candidatus Neomarinimicrobiota bacterium]